MYPPMLARESAATMTPLSKMKESVVVPFLLFTISLVAFWKPSNCTGTQHERTDQRPIRQIAAKGIEGWGRGLTSLQVGNSRASRSVSVAKTPPDSLPAAAKWFSSAEVSSLIVIASTAGAME